MMFDWSNYLDLAKLLLQPRTNGAEDLLEETCLRAAISRAYYAAFGVALAFAVGIDADRLLVADNKHALLINWYGQRQRVKRDYATISQKLRKLRDDRNQADYDAAPISSIAKKAAEVVTQAEMVIRTVQGLSAASPR
jgi:uncharacterized protein (UPF0332 family)